MVTAFIRRERELKQFQAEPEVFLKIFNKSERHGKLTSGGFYMQTSSLSYNDRLRIKFGLNGAYCSHVGLVRGLIDFYRSKDFKFSFAWEEKTFEVDLETAHYHKLDCFLVFLHDVLIRELEFKAALKRVIGLELKYKREMTAVYNSLLTDK